MLAYSQMNHLKHTSVKSLHITINVCEENAFENVWKIGLWPNCVKEKSKNYVKSSLIKLEQLERLHSENTPCRPMITHILLIHIRSQVKTWQSQSYKF